MSTNKGELERKMITKGPRQGVRGYQVTFGVDGVDKVTNLDEVREGMPTHMAQGVRANAREATAHGYTEQEAREKAQRYLALEQRRLGLPEWG